jgi:tRNA nucleotidyltransferase/poly(A) polymerase
MSEPRQPDPGDAPLIEDARAALRHGGGRAACAIIEDLCGAGHEAVLAGGCVRDMLLGATPKDFDVATSARPDEVLGLFSRTRAVGRQFGVILVRHGRHWIEVATFRTDASYSDGRRPDAVTFGTMEGDAQRRDFTINGMFYDPVGARVLDFVGGGADLSAGVIRAIGRPAARFGEDHLRLLRAVRFAARLGFSIEPATWRALCDAAPLLLRVSAERVADELDRMLTHQSRAAAWRMLCDAGLHRGLWTDAPARPDCTIAARFDALSNVPGISFALAVAILSVPDPRTAQRVSRALKCSNELRETAAWLVRHARDPDEPDRLSLADLKRLMAHPAFGDLLMLTRARNGADGRDDVSLRRIRARAAAIAPERVAPPPLFTGDDLLALGVAAGPIYKRVLNRVYDAQLNESITTRDEALALARDLLKDARP